MNHPDSEKNKFISAHQGELSQMITRENLRRENRNLPPLTDEEIDEGVSEMMEIERSGGRLRSFRFKASASPQEPTDKMIQEVPATEGLPVRREATYQVKIQQTHKNSIHFEVVLCANGFILNLKKKGEEESFIFKNEKDLTAILKDALKNIQESKKEKLSEQGDNNG